MGVNGQLSLSLNEQCKTMDDDDSEAQKRKVEKNTHRLILKDGERLLLTRLGDRDLFRGCGDRECLRTERDRDLLNHKMPRI